MVILARAEKEIDTRTAAADNEREGHPGEIPKRLRRPEPVVFLEGGCLPGEPVDSASGAGTKEHLFALAEFELA